MTVHSTHLIDNQSPRPQIKGFLEVVEVIGRGYAACRLVTRQGDEPIHLLDNIYNPFYWDFRVLRIGLVGEFTPDYSPYTREQLANKLRRMDCFVVDEVDADVDLVILAQPRHDLLPITRDVRRYLELTEYLSIKEILVTDALCYLPNQ